MHLVAELLGFEPGVSWAELYLEDAGWWGWGGYCPAGALRTFAWYTEPVTLLVTGTSPDDPDDAEGPEPRPGRDSASKAKPPKSAEAGGAL